jgi:hypothetical protein
MTDTGFQDFLDKIKSLSIVSAKPKAPENCPVCGKGAGPGHFKLAAVVVRVPRPCAKRREAEEKAFAA